MRQIWKKEERALTWHLLKTMLVLAIPTIFEQILSTLLQYVDTAMVGRLGEQATAAVSATTTVTWLVSSLASAIGVATLAMISKSVGEQDKKSVQSIAKQSLLLVVVVGIVLGTVSMLLSPFIPKWMGADSQIQKEASRYFFIISIPMLFREANTIFGAALRATKDTVTPMAVNFLSNILNIILNYVCIYLLQLGVEGAAISSAICYTISGTLMFLAYRKNDWHRWKWNTFAIDWDKLKECAKIGLPVLGTSLTSCLGYVVFAAQVFRMGTVTFAAHSIAVTAETIFYIPGYGLRTATSTMVGIALGEKDEKKFERISALGIFVTMVMMLCNGALLFVAAGPLMSLFSTSKEVVSLGVQMLKIVAFSEPFFGLMIIVEGILYGLGRTRYAFFVETFSMWGIRIFFTALCVNVWHLSLREVWYCMIADNICKALLLLLPLLLKKQREKLFPKDDVKRSEGCYE